MRIRKSQFSCQFPEKLEKNELAWRYKRTQSHNFIRDAAVKPDYAAKEEALKTSNYYWSKSTKYKAEE